MESLENQFLEGLLLLTTSGHEAESSNSVRKYSNPPIPVDLLIEIFSRVPLKTIARSRCVSKFLASILRRPDFTELFLTKSLTRPRLLFTMKYKGKMFFYSSPKPQNPDDNSSLVATPYHTSSFRGYIPSAVCRTVCGLVLLQGWDRNALMICNPATGEFLTLPKVVIKEKHIPKVKPESNQTGIYFGYDPVEKQFKVLSMYSSRDERPYTYQVLTLDSGKRLWRTFERKFHFVEDRRMRGEICINGVLYFGTSFWRFSRIVCFDVRSEKFSFINMNQDRQLVGSHHVGGALTLFNYKGKLGIHDNRYENRLENRLVLWILEDAGNHKWSKHVFVLSPSDNDALGHKMFVGMTGTGEIVMSASNHKPPFYVSFYNLESKSFNRVYIQRLEKFKHGSTLDAFVDYVENMKSM